MAFYMKKYNSYFYRFTNGLENSDKQYIRISVLKLTFFEKRKTLYILIYKIEVYIERIV